MVKCTKCKTEYSKQVFNMCPICENKKSTPIKGKETVYFKYGPDCESQPRDAQEVVGEGGTK
jgi:hypothetical protein